jgi:aspartyl-tRNA(Asn)/glutamyl-tRNA(Gln) amidotransferase subunit A
VSEELWALSARELGALLRSGQASVLEVVEAVLARIQAADPEINAYITVAAEEALADARRCDAELAAGRDRGPLHGIPLAVKDLYDTAGVRTTSGSRILGDRVPVEDAAAVARLRSAGAVLVGKTNLNEFACGVTTTNTHYGDTRNPWDLTRSPGGSSGGSAAALAAGLCTLALGTDTGGSIRIPAALCGVVGLKPTYGRVSCRGIMPLSWEQDHAGPMARTVWDVAAVLAAMAGWDSADPASRRAPVPDYVAGLGGGLDGLRLGVDRDFALRSIGSEVRVAFEAALQVLAELGARVVDVDVPRLEEGMEAGLVIWGAEAAAVHAEWLRTRAEDYDPLVRSRLEPGLALSGAEVARAQRLRRLLQRDLQLLFEEVDLLATPTCALEAPPRGARSVVLDGVEVEVLSALTRFSRVFNLLGLPAISVPCGFTAGGLPLGLQLVGAELDDARVLRAAYGYEQATAWHRRRCISTAS